jgi:DNA polymerase-3 subunit chi
VTRVDFYVLADDDTERWLDYGCRLIQKAQRQSLKTLVLFDDEHTLNQLDQALWNFQPESYVPHAKLGSGSEDLPVLLSQGQDCDTHHDMLVSFGTNIPKFFGRFERYAHIVNQDKGRISAARLNYKYFKDRAYPLHYHNIKLPNHGS